MRTPLALLILLAPNVASAQQFFGTNAPAGSGSPVTATGGTTPITLGDWLGQQVNAPSQGVLANGTTDNAALLATAAALAVSTGKPLVLPSSGVSSYLLNSDVTVPAGNFYLQRDPGAAFSGAGFLRLDNVVPYQVTPVTGMTVGSYSFDSTFNGYSNIFANGTVAKNNGTTAPVVAVFGEGIVTAAGAPAWGGNFVGVNTAIGGTAWAIEANPVNLGDGASTVYGLYDACSGSAQCADALHVQANNANANFKNGITFNGLNFNPVTGSLIFAQGTNWNTAKGLDLFNATFTTAEISTQTFRVDATPVMTNGSGIATRGSNGTNPFVYAFGNGTAAAGANLNLASPVSIRLSTGTVPTPDTQMQILATAAAVDYWTFTGGTASNIVMAAAGTDANINVTMRSAGTGGFIFTDGSSHGLLTLGAPSSAANKISLNAANTGNPVTFSCSGDASCGVKISPPGNTLFGPGTAKSLSDTTGFLQIQTMAGIPTGVTGAAGQASIIINTSSHKLCHSEGGGTWFDATGAACT